MARTALNAFRIAPFEMWKAETEAPFVISASPYNLEEDLLLKLVGRRSVPHVQHP